MAGGWQLGNAGQSVTEAGFGQAGVIGAQGERVAGQVLGQLASLGPTVVNDIRIPIPGFTANIDHAVISGRHITLIDAKVWKPGFYFTIGGHTFRGIQPVPHLDKKTLPTGVDAIGRHLDRLGVRHRFRQSVLLVFSPPRQHKTGNYLLYRPHGARVVTSLGYEAITPAQIGSLARKLARHTGTAPADPKVTAAVHALRYT